MQGLLRLRTCFDGVNPVVIRGRVVGVLLEDGLENRQRLFLPGARLAVIVVAIRERPGQKNARLHVLGIAFHELAEELNLLGLRRALIFLFGFLGGLGSGTRFDVQPLRFAGVALQADCFG